MNNWFKRKRYFYVSCVYKSEKLEVECLTFFMTSKSYNSIEELKNIAKIVLLERYNINKSDFLCILAVTKVSKKEYNESLINSQFTQITIK